MQVSRVHVLYTRGMSTTTPLVLIDPEIMGGKPCFSGTRVPVQMLFDWLARGHTIDYFVDQIRSVKIEQARAVLDRAAELVRADASIVVEPAIA